MTGSINDAFFFDNVRRTLFDGGLNAKQKSGLSTILSEWKAEYAKSDDRWLAYALATAHHETGRTMQPIKEWGRESYFFDMYDKDGLRPDVAKQLGNTQPGDGARFPGRGYVQLTGRTNYAYWGARLKKDLTGNPDLVKVPAIAVFILFHGMEEGRFTGKKLSDYLSGGKTDWKNARRIINGVDKADLIASYAVRYYASISYTT